MNKTISRLWFLRKVLITVTLPGYYFFIFHLKCIVGMFNSTIRAVWFKYLVQREDIFYMRMFVGLALIYLNIVVIKPLPVFNQYFGPRIPGYEVFAHEVRFWWDYLKWWYSATSFIAAPLALMDEFIFKPLYVAYVLKPSASRERLAYREKAIEKNAVFIGTDSKSSKPLYITDEMRSLHCHLLGTTGSGKTESIIFPMLFQDICRGRGAIIVDAKSEIKFFKKIYTYHLRENPTEKKQEIYIVNLGNPEFSNTYNPLLRGNAIELKDRIMGSLVWSEVFYKKKAEEILLVIFLALESIKKRVTFRDLYILLTEKAAVQYLYDQVQDASIKRSIFNTILSDFKSVASKCSGIIADLNILAHGGFAKIVNTYEPDIDLVDVYQNNKIVYFALPTNLLEETAKMFGRMLLMDLKSCAGYIHMGEVSSHFFGVFVDEAGDFVTESFIAFLNKARSTKISILLAHQSNADLDRLSRDGSITEQVIDNTNLKFCMRVNAPKTAESFSNQLGTKTVDKETTRIDKGVLVEAIGNQGSLREVEEYQVHPNVLKKLGQGQALVFGKHPKVFSQIIHSDYYPDPESYEEVVLFHRDYSQGEGFDGLNIESQVQCVPLDGLKAGAGKVEKGHKKVTPKVETDLEKASESKAIKAEDEADTEQERLELEGMGVDDDHGRHPHDDSDDVCKIEL